MSLRCKLGWHSWRLEEVWKPGFNAPIVVENITYRVCRRCGKKYIWFHYKDWEFRPEAWDNGKLRMNQYENDPRLTSYYYEFYEDFKVK